MEKFQFRLNLFLFDDGAAAGAADGGNGESTNSADDAQLAEAPKYVKGKRDYPKRPKADAQPAQAEPMSDSPAQTEQTPEDLDAEWDSLIKGKFKDHYGKGVKSAIDSRFKNQNDAMEALGKFKPMLDHMIKQRNLTEGDYEGLINAYMDDDSLYEDAAIEHGNSIETERQLQKLARENEQYRAAQQRSMEQELFQKHLAGLREQAEALKQTYPSFDLDKELQNEQFARMTSPSGGMSLETAFHALHWRELQPQMMQAAVQVTQQKAANAIAAGSKRPVESGARSTAAVNITPDYSGYKANDFRKMQERARRGEKISIP